MEKILVDGYNLLHKDPALQEMARHSLEQAREALLDQLAAYRSGDMLIRVVFDGREGGAGSAGRRRQGVEVRFSRPPRSADETILEIIAAEPRRSSLLVVTSDVKDIGRAARAEGARWISSEAFLRRLHKARRPKGRSRQGVEGEKPGLVGASEVEYWLRKFEPGPEGTDPEPPRGRAHRRLRREPAVPSRAGRGYRGGSGGR
ncbi:MAG TPA: NYN domain-containing protein [Candidatus Polarisedimenticolia bacterium]|nr:NYN domain-containing protein [Candidatus Polarisedimenticolia bacterium]